MKVRGTLKNKLKYHYICFNEKFPIAVDADIEIRIFRIKRKYVSRCYVLMEIIQYDSFGL
ncbi:MAG: hypothetical protein K2K29_02195 [Muribaculaceae bacterium]|nr:hypothetical protein [Muribaculaceae bacterium]